MMTLLLPMLALGIGCAPEPETVHIWSGWNQRWDMLSHRVSLLGAVMEADGSGTVHLIGGDYSTGANLEDNGLSRIRDWTVTDTDLAVVHGSTELTIGPEEVGSHTESISAPEVAALDTHVVVLRGFSLDTDVAQTDDYPLDLYDPALGYTSRGFAFGVEAEPDLSGDTLSFEVRGTVRWGEAGIDDPIDRSDMNAAIPHATALLTVHWTLIGLSGTVELAEASALGSSLDG